VKREVIQTADGSSTIRIEEMDENYHSGHGALQEARHVFIRNGIDLLKEKKTIRVFEMGFGTGLNAILAAEFALKNDVFVDYFGIEAYPVEEALISQLNYIDLVSEDLKETFNQMHTASWNVKHQLTPSFQFQKIHAKIEAWEHEKSSFDIVFFDAFGPRAQGEMWDITILKKMHELLVPGGIFVTYCAKGQLKRDLRSLGFEVESLPGPPGKREMTRGVKRF
jgi:tRNA U34 5-methylaminomethyl-2-thiouridine-forming methyltransferase MnmC